MKPLQPLLLGLAAALLWGCEKPVPVTGGDGRQEAPSLTFRGFEARTSHEGALMWEARAVRATVWQGRSQALAEEVDMTYFADGKAVSQARADKAEMDLKSYDVKARGHVVVHGSNGVVLSTSSLDWDNKRQLATSEAAVRVERGNTVLTGTGFKADRRLDSVRILHEVKAEAATVRDLRKAGEGMKR